MKRERLSVEIVKQEIIKRHGNLSSVAKALGWSRSQVRRFVFAHKKLVEVMEEARDDMSDNVQSEFYRTCLDASAQGHVTAMIFYLKTRCGWTETQNVKIDDGSAVSVHLYIPDNQRDNKGDDK